MSNSVPAQNNDIDGATSLADVGTFDYSTVAPDVATNLRTIAATIKRVAADTIVVIGNHLITANESLDHGAFIDWVEQECGMKKRTAQDYMSAARFVEGKNATVALLPPKVLYSLAAKSTPTEIVTDVMARLDRGERITEDSIKVLKNATRCEQTRDKKRADCNFRRTKAWKQKVAASEAKAKEREQAVRDRAQALLDDLVATYGTEAIIDIAHAVNAEIYFLDVARNLAASAKTELTASNVTTPSTVLRWSTPTIIPSDALPRAGEIVEPPLAEVAA